MTNFVNKYKEHNESFSPTYIYKFGTCGFYSDFNNMILNMLWCYQHHLRFCLYSQNCATFGKKGWTKYFEPIFPQSTCYFHKLFNNREIGTITDNHLSSIIKLRFSNLCIFSYQLITNNYLMKDTFYIPRQSLYSKWEFKLPELGIYGDLQEVCHTLVHSVYRFNRTTLSHIKALWTPLHLPKKYIGLHIRRGDKDIEWNPINIDTYISKVRDFTKDIKDIFVFTDDYQVYRELTEKYPDLHFYTLATKEDHGYNNKDFLTATSDIQEKKTLNMFAAMDLLSRAEHFVGTLNTNPGMFLGMFMDKKQVHYVDAECWDIM